MPAREGTSDTEFFGYLDHIKQMPPRIAELSRRRYLTARQESQVAAEVERISGEIKAARKSVGHQAAFRTPISLKPNGFREVTAGEVAYAAGDAGLTVSERSDIDHFMHTHRNY